MFAFVRYDFSYISGNPMVNRLCGKRAKCVGQKKGAILRSHEFEEGKDKLQGYRVSTVIFVTFFFAVKLCPPEEVVRVSNT